LHTGGVVFESIADAANQQPPEWTAAVIIGLVLAVIAAIAAVGALHYAKKSRRAADQANVIALRGEARSTERHDVYWEGRWVRAGRWVLVKRGADEACNVTARVNVDGEDAIQDAELISDDGHELTFELLEAEKAWVSEMVVIRPRLLASSGRITPEQVPSWCRHHVRWRVDWTTRRGQPKHDADALDTTFIKFYRL
jgi:hypothetical protein